MDSKLTINISNGLKKNLLENIKSNYILNKLFNNLKRAKLLNLIKYNNYIKNRLNININDYYECSLIIEIEIKRKNMVNLLIFMEKIKNIVIFILMIIKKK